MPKDTHLDMFEEKEQKVCCIKGTNQEENSEKQPMYWPSIVYCHPPTPTKKKGEYTHNTWLTFLPGKQQQHEVVTSSSGGLPTVSNVTTLVVGLILFLEGDSILSGYLQIIVSQVPFLICCWIRITPHSSNE